MAYTQSSTIKYIMLSLVNGILKEKESFKIEKEKNIFRAYK